jgi:flavin-binding protein dodecin
MSPYYTNLNNKGDIIIMAKLVKVIEVLAQSDKSWDDAAQQAVGEASKTLRNIRSIYVKELEARVENAEIVEFRINAKISFDLESDRMEKSSK